MRSGFRRISWIYLCLALLAAALPAIAEDEAASEGQQPARKTFDAWLEVYNSATEDRIADFIGERFSPDFLAQIPADALVAFHNNLMRDQGELTLDRIEEDGPSLFVALVRDASGGWLQVTMGVEPEAPHRITGMRIVPPEKTPAESEDGGGGADSGESSGAAKEDEPPMTWPTSQAGRIGRGWVEAFNTEGEEAMRRFEAAHRTKAALGAVPMDERIDRFRQIRRQLGEITPSRVLSEDGEKLTVLAKSAAGPPWIELGFELGGEDASKLSTISLRATSPQTASLDFAGADSFLELLKRTLEASGAPGIAAAWVEGDAIAEQAVAGMRKSGGEEAIESADLFHFGSVTKSITATMIGGLVQQEVMGWDDTIGEVLGDLEPGEVYREMTVEDLLRHRARVQSTLTFDGPEMERLVGLPGSATEQREAFAREALAAAPGPAGMSYSNAGYTIAALMAERKSGKDWETLLREGVFGPLGLESAGFGWPATADRIQQPHGHFEDASSLRVQGVDEYPLGDFLAPAGNVHGSVTDLARYASAHLAGLRGTDGALRATTVNRLHTAPASEGGMPYAAGWVLGETEDGGSMHWHNGSAGTFYALVALFPDDNSAFVLAANAGASRTESVAMKLLEELRSRRQAAPPAP